MSGCMRVISLPSLNECQIRQPAQIIAPHVMQVVCYTQEDILADCGIPPGLKIYKSEVILHLFPVRIGFQ